MLLYMICTTSACMHGSYPVAGVICGGGGDDDEGMGGFHTSSSQDVQVVCTKKEGWGTCVFVCLPLGVGVRVLVLVCV